MNRQLQTRQPARPFPAGVRTLLVEETLRRRRVEQAIVDALLAASFAEVILPIIDFADPYAAVTSLDHSRSAYRFTDRNGDLVSIRSDFTPMLARAAAVLVESSPPPLRLFYRGDVVRCVEPRLGKSREYFQIGAEIVGDSSAEADIEIITTAVRCVRSAGVEPRVVLSGICSAERGSAILAVVQKDAEVVAAERRDDSSYYTGVQFQILPADSMRVVASGGRYDSLYGAFGIDTPAVGFTITVDLLEAM